MQLQVHCGHDQLVDPKDLKPNPRNPNSHPPEQIEAFKEVLRYNGWRKPIVVSLRSNCVVKGHGALLAALALDLAEVPVEYQSYDSDEHELADMIADNELARYSQNEEKKLALLIQDMKAQQIETHDVAKMTALSTGRIDDLIANLKTVFFPEGSEQKDPDTVPELPKVAITNRGNIWQLGRHRLMCGDSTDRGDVDRLMDGEKAELLWTDPPYGVSYADKNAFLNALSKGNAVQERILGDHQTPEEMNEFWFKALENAHAVLSDKCSYYIASPQGGDLMMMMMMMSIIRAGFQLKHMLIWVKNNHVLGRCDYNYKYEPMLYGWKESGTHEFYGKGQCKTSVWEFNKPIKNDLHPTMKPVELIEEAVLNSSPDYGSVLDLFGGSGSTLIACEKTKRKCFMMELDPLYCDVIVKRWEDFTGQKAELLSPTQD